MNEELAKYELELHELKGDTDLSRYENKSNRELKDLVKNFETKLSEVQAVLEGRIKD